MLPHRLVGRGASASSPSIIRRYAIAGARGGAPFTGTLRIDGPRARGARLRIEQMLRYEDGRVDAFEGTGVLEGGLLEALGREASAPPGGDVAAAGDRSDAVLRVRHRPRRPDDDPLRDGFVESLLAARGGAAPRAPAEADGHLCGEWTREEELDEAKIDEIDRYFSTGERGTFAGHGGVRISHVTFRAEDEVAALVVAPGRSQTYRAYAELVYDLRRSGLTVYLLDHRGQGHSERLLGADADPTSAAYQRGHVEDFDHYVRDMERFIDGIVRPEEHARTFALGHSMGGGILTLYAEQNPGRLDALVLSAPLHQLSEPWYLPLFLRRGPRERYLSEWLFGPWSPGSGKALELISTCARRRELSNRVYESDPTVRVGGPTVGWVLAAREATRRMREHAHRIVDPLLVIQGSGDRVVAPEGHREVVERAEQARLVVLEGALHDAITGEDHHRHAFLDLMLAFFDRHL